MAKTTPPEPDAPEVALDPEPLDPAETGVAPDYEAVATHEGPGDPDALGTHANSTEPDAPEGQPAATREEVADRIRQGIPEMPRPAKGTTLLATPGGFMVVPEGVTRDQLGSNAISRDA